MNLDSALKHMAQGESLQAINQDGFTSWHIGLERIQGNLATELLRRQYVRYASKGEDVQYFAITPQGVEAIQARARHRTIKRRDRYARNGRGHVEPGQSR